MSGLLISVRDAVEATAAADGGATLIDVKEPANGPLGRPETGAVREVFSAIAGRLPTSVALGEWIDHRPESFPMPGLTPNYVKWGLAGLARKPDLLTNWERGRQRAESTGSCVVAVAYADAEAADSPDPWSIAELAVEHRFTAFLIDTFHKDGRTLVDRVGPSDLGRLCEYLRERGVRIALAGSLGLAEIDRLRPLKPDWFAVRGAACEGGRGGRVTADRVRKLAELARSAGPAAEGGTVPEPQE